MSAVTTVAVVGFLLGVRHAFEPDHLAAVSTLATRQGTIRDAARLGLAWGLGHTASVVAVAAALILADWRLPPVVQPVAELVVAALLISLGVLVLVRHGRRHRASLGEPHRHAHTHHAPHGHVPPARDLRASFAFGLAHGLAGSGAVVVLLVAAAASRSAQAVYLAAFGGGTVGGMLTVSASLAFATRSAVGAERPWAGWLHLGAAVLSVAAGIMLAAQTAGAL